MTWTIYALGNPEDEYQKTRHNAGMTFLSYVLEKESFDERTFDAKKHASYARGTVDGARAVAVFPELFMNETGRAAKFFYQKGKGKQFVAIHDDLDIPIGSFKLSFARGAAGHKGVLSLFRSLKDNEFWRLRIGVSPSGARGLRKPKGEEAVKRFVLGAFTKKEREILEKKFPAMRDALHELISGRRRAPGRKA